VACFSLNAPPSTGQADANMVMAALVAGRIKPEALSATTHT